MIARRSLPPRVTHTEPPAMVTEFGRPPTATRRVTRPAAFPPGAGGAVVAVLAVVAVSVPPPPSPPPPRARAATTASARIGIAASAHGSQRRPPCSERGGGA